MDPLVTQRQFMLGYCVAKYIHVFHGWVFGPITRRMFLGSLEKSGQIDCVFETKEDAEYFLKTIKVENRVDFLREGQHGLNEYRVMRQIDGFHTNIDLRIHAMHSGLTRRKRIPRNIVEPCFDLDYFFWRSDGLERVCPCSAENQILGWRSARGWRTQSARKGEKVLCGQRVVRKKSERYAADSRTVSSHGAGREF